MLEPFDQPLASGFGDSAGFMDRMGSEQNSAFDSFYKFLDNSGRLLTMMRYLQPRELERRGLDKFDPWTGTYGVVNESLEPTPSGGYAVTARFSRFKNLPELKALWQNVADIRVAREVPEMQRARPHMVDEEGQLSDRIYVMAPMHPALEGYMEEIRERASEIKAGKVDPKDDNMLKLSNDAGEAALDVRMQDPNAPYNPEGKLAMVADNVARIYREEDDKRGTQLVFLDRGTPPTTAGRKAKQKDGYLVNLYEHLRTEMERRGVPRDQIAFIHEGTDDDKRYALMQKVNDGEIRVLMASTEKGGTGVNVQKRAAALHHVDAAWRPSDIEQREGRAIRQGNIYGPKFNEDGQPIQPGEGVKIYVYLQEGSFDEFKWGTIKEKAIPIGQIMSRKIIPNERETDDIDDFAVSAAMAMSSRDPVALKAVELEESIKRLRTLKLAVDSDSKAARGRLREMEWLARRNEGAVPRMEADAAGVPPAPESKEFKVTVKGEEYDSRGDASKAIGEAVTDSWTNYNDKFRANSRHRAIGTYRGFDIEAVNDGQGNYFVTLVGPSGQDYQTEFLPKVLLRRATSSLGILSARSLGRPSRSPVPFPPDPAALL